MVDALRYVHDAEIPVVVSDLGVLYAIGVDSEGETGETPLTSPNYPIARQTGA